jgi:MFS family permease
MLYGWVVLGAAFVVIMIGIGSMFSMGVFLVPLQEEFGWTRSQISVAGLLNWLAFGLFSFIFGMLSDRIGTRRVVLTGGVLFGLGMMLCGLTQQLWHLYLTFGLLGGMGVGAMYVPLSATATRWFTRNRGLAVAIVSAGNGTGILLMAPLARYLITTFDWATAFALVGILGWVIILPAALLVRNSPTDLGSKAEASPMPRSESHASDTVVPGPGEMSGRDAGKTPAFWMIALTHFLCCAAHSGPIFHMAAFATDVGIPKMAAATILGISGFVSIAGRIGTGVIADRLGAKHTLVTMLALQAVSVALYLLAGPLWTLLALAVVFGVAYGGVMPLYAVLTRQYFGSRVMGTMYGAVFGISAIGMGLGTYLGGFFYDRAGTYTGLYLFSVVLGVAAMLAGLGLRRPHSSSAKLLAVHSSP